MKLNNRLAIIIPVWGKKYSNILVNYCFESFLTKNNLPYLDKKLDLIRIITSKNDAKYFSNSKIIERLKKYINVEIIICDLDLNFSKYQLVSELHKIGLNQLPRYNFFMMHHPDDCLVDGTLKFIIKNMKKYKLIVTMSLRVSTNVFLDKIKNFSNNLRYNTLLENVLSSLHPLAENLIFESDKFRNDWPSHIYWTDNNSFIGRGIHLHPLVINLQDFKKTINFSGTVDDYRFLNKITKNDFSKIKVVDDKLQIISLTEDSNIDFTLQKFDFLKYIFFVSKHSAKIHRYFFKHRIVLKTNNSNHRFVINSKEHNLLKRYNKYKILIIFLSIYYLIYNKYVYIKIVFLLIFHPKKFIKKIIYKLNINEKI